MSGRALSAALFVLSLLAAPAARGGDLQYAPGKQNNRGLYHGVKGQGNKSNIISAGNSSSAKVVDGREVGISGIGERRVDARGNVINDKTISEASKAIVENKSDQRAALIRKANQIAMKNKGIFEQACSRNYEDSVWYDKVGDVVLSTVYDSSHASDTVRAQPLSIGTLKKTLLKVHNHPAWERICNELGRCTNEKRDHDWFSEMDVISAIQLDALQKAYLRLSNMDASSSLLMSHIIDCNTDKVLRLDPETGIVYEVTDNDGNETKYDKKIDFSELQRHNDGLDPYNREEFASLKQKALKDSRFKQAMSNLIDTSRLEVLLKNHISILKAMLQKGTKASSSEIAAHNANVNALRDESEKIASKIKNLNISDAEQKRLSQDIYTRLESYRNEITRLEEGVLSKGIAVELKD